jgi:hypothetical protein
MRRHAEPDTDYATPLRAALEAERDGWDAEEHWEAFERAWVAAGNRLTTEWRDR